VRALYVVLTISTVLGCSSQVGNKLQGSGSTQEKTLFHQGLEREYLLYTPTTVRSYAPLVVVMHGYTGNMDDIASYVGMNQLADENGFLVAYPQGTEDPDGNNFFNVGYDFHSSSNVDDVGFVRAMVEEIDNQNELNKEAIFATGMSNGGDMSFLLACKASDLFRAVAPVAGSMMTTMLSQCEPEIALPVLEIHGDEDRVTRLGGDKENEDGWGAYWDLETTMAFWAKKNGLSERKEVLSEYPNGDGKLVRSITWHADEHSREVRFLVIQGGGHDWPGGRFNKWSPTYWLGRVAFGLGDNQAFNSSELIWSFFQESLGWPRMESKT
jgi:polyhydroxybutyrate depolymerase